MMNIYININLFIFFKIPIILAFKIALIRGHLQFIYIYIVYLTYILECVCNRN